MPYKHRHTPARTQPVALPLARAARNATLVPYKGGQILFAVTGVTCCHEAVVVVMKLSSRLHLLVYLYLLEDGSW